MTYGHDDDPSVIYDSRRTNGEWHFAKKSGTAYYLLTIDRDAWTGPRTYGNIHWYYAKEFAKGFWEYEDSN